jgi:hypothetical protein
MASCESRALGSAPGGWFRAHPCRSVGLLEADPAQEQGTKVCCSFCGPARLCMGPLMQLQGATSSWEDSDDVACHRSIRTAHIMLRMGIRGLLFTNKHTFLVSQK